jgi:hypothetical protein
MGALKERPQNETSPDSVSAEIEAEGNTKQTSLNFTTAKRFIGTNSPKRIRALIALVYRDWVSREDLDRLIGASNSPDSIMNLRRNHGLEIIMREVKAINRDGRPCWFGEYNLKHEDKVMVREWLETHGHAELVS